MQSRGVYKVFAMQPTRVAKRLVLITITMSSNMSRSDSNDPDYRWLNENDYSDEEDFLIGSANLLINDFNQLPDNQLEIQELAIPRMLGGEKLSLAVRHAESSLFNSLVNKYIVGSAEARAVVHENTQNLRVALRMWCASDPGVWQAFNL